MEVGLEEPLTVNEIRFVSLKSLENTGRQTEVIANKLSEPDMRVERHNDIPVYSIMKADLAGESFRISRVDQPEVSLKDGIARWSWKLSPKEGFTGIQQIFISISTNARTYRTLEGAIFVTPVETPTKIPLPPDTPKPIPTGTPATAIPTKPAAVPDAKPVPVPTAVPVPVATPTPVPFDTPAPA